MLNVSDATKAAYLSPSHKSLVVTFPNKNITITSSDLIEESFELSESIEEEKNLTFKGCIASICKFQVAQIVTDLRGEYLEVTIQAGDTETITLFRGYVKSQDNETHEDIVTTFICYDRLNTIGSQNMQSWLDGLTFPITVKNFRNSLFTTLGITQESTTLVNDSLSISANVKNFLENPTALDLMRYICQLNGRFGQLGRDGVFYYRDLKPISEGLYPSETTYPGNDTYPSAGNAGITITPSETKNIEYQPFTVEKISGVYIADADGITQGEIGTTTNPFVISDNPLAFSVPMMRAAQNLYAKVAETDFTPVISMSCIGLPYVECGDTYLTYTRINAVRSYVLNRTLKGIQALTDTFASNCDQYQPPYKATATTRINANRKSILSIQADIVEINELKATKAEVGELSAREANFEQATAENFRVTGEMIATKASIQELNAATATLQGLIAQRATIQELNATSANLESMIAQRATIQELNATSASLQNMIAQRATIAELNATSANLQNMIATKASIQELNAATASLESLIAKKIDADTVRANYMEVANWTTSGKIRADKISANLVAAGGLRVSGIICENTVSAESMTTDYINGKAIALNGRSLSWISITTVSGTYHVIGYR